MSSLKQELAYNFYPERFDFTVVARASMLRPRGQQWFRIDVHDPELIAALATFIDLPDLN